MFLDSTLLVNQQKLEGMEKDITCPICQGILNDPYFCIKCQNNFCNQCICKYKLNSKKCPFRCENPQYMKNLFLNKIFAELLKFKCKKGCDEIIQYQKVNTHNENCKKEDFKEKYFESATQVEILKVQIEDYKDMKNEFQERNNELEEKFKNLKDEFYTEEEYDYNYDNYESIKEKIGILKDKLNEIINNIKNELNEYGDYDEDENLEEKITKLENLNDNLISKYEDIREKNLNLKEQINILENEKADMNKKAKIAQEKIKELEKKIKK